MLPMLSSRAWPRNFKDGLRGDCAMQRGCGYQGFTSDNVEGLITICNHYTRVSDKGYYVNFISSKMIGLYYQCAVQDVFNG